MQFAGILKEGGAGGKALHWSASSKVLLREGEFEQAEVVRERVQVQVADLAHHLRLYQWRSATEFPIVRVAAWSVRASEGQSVELEVLRQSVPLLLEGCGELALFRALYLLKETLIACERLFQRFGAFRISARMVGVNNAHKCRVWISEQLASNHFEPTGEEESAFLRRIGSLFEGKTLKGKASATFYLQLEKCSNFAAALGFLDHYSRENKIAIPSFFKHDRLPDPANTAQNAKFQPSLTMTRSPRFIASLRDTLTPATRLMEEPLIAKEDREAKSKGEGKIGKQVKDMKEVKEVKPSLLALKKSAETRADIYGSGTMTLTDSKSREDLLQHPQFLSAQEISSPSEKMEKMQKSELLQFKPRAQRPHKPTHRLTNRELFSCFTPQPHPHSRPHDQFDHWDSTKFLAEEESESKGLEGELESLFEKNHWEQRIGGLFGEGELKRSVHAGEPQWRHEDHDLPLLQHFGKAIRQSSLHDDH